MNKRYGGILSKRFDVYVRPSGSGNDFDHIGSTYDEPTINTNHSKYEFSEYSNIVITGRMVNITSLNLGMHKINANKLIIKAIVMIYLNKFIMKIKDIMINIFNRKNKRGIR